MLHEVRVKLLQWGVGNYGEQLKERRTENIWVLQHKQSDPVRLLMRRDAVHEVCCNHLVPGTLQITSLAANDRALMQFAKEVSGEDAALALHTCIARFKTSGNAVAFITAVEKTKAAISE